MVNIELTNSDSDADVSDVIDTAGIPFSVKGNASLQLTRVLGTTDTVAVNVQMSNDSVTWTTILTETDVTGGITDVTIVTDKIARYYRVLMTTVGSGNRLSAFVVIN